ncbi:MAG TPA: carbon-nitrogen hydrolase family protein [Planctomycetota bacterium]|nr:carbon-nitrogen hydrolase family protein [Planctomycetota bacterium]
MLKLALVQFQVEPHAPEANLAKAERFVAQAAAAGAELVVFPEYFVTGPLGNRKDLADADGRYRAAFQAMAKGHGVDLVPGSIAESEGGRFHNTAYYIASDGSVPGRYRKVNLWVSEKLWVTPGEGAVVCDTRFGRVGLAICWDLAFPELFRDMLRQGAEIVVCPSCWCFEDAGAGQRHNPRAEELFVDSLCVARAFENEVAVAFCNVAGEFDTPGGRRHSMGHSQVAVPFKGAVALLGHSDEAMLVAEIDTSILSDAESAYEIRKDLAKARGDDWMDG